MSAFDEKLKKIETEARQRQSDEEITFGNVGGEKKFLDFDAILKKAQKEVAKKEKAILDDSSHSPDYEFFMDLLDEPTKAKVPPSERTRTASVSSGPPPLDIGDVPSEPKTPPPPHYPPPPPPAPKWDAAIHITERTEFEEQVENTIYQGKDEWERRQEERPVQEIPPSTPTELSRSAPIQRRAFDASSMDLDADVRSQVEGLARQASAIEIDESLKLSTEEIAALTAVASQKNADGSPTEAAKRASERLIAWFDQQEKVRAKANIASQQTNIIMDRMIQTGEAERVRKVVKVRDDRYFEEQRQIMEASKLLGNDLIRITAVGDKEVAVENERGVKMIVSKNGSYLYLKSDRFLYRMMKYVPRNNSIFLKFEPPQDLRGPELANIVRENIPMLADAGMKDEKIIEYVFTKYNETERDINIKDIQQHGPRLENPPLR